MRLRQEVEVHEIHAESDYDEDDDGQVGGAVAVEPFVDARVFDSHRSVPQHEIHADDYDEDGDGQSREVKQPSGNLPRLHRSVLPSSRMQIVDMAIPTAGVTLTVGVQDPKYAQYASDDDGHKCEDLEEFEEPFFECKPPIGYEFEEPFAQGLPHLFEGNKSTLFSRSEEPYDSHMTHSYRLTEGRLIRYPLNEWD